MACPDISPKQEQIWETDSGQAPICTDVSRGQQHLDEDSYPGEDGSFTEWRPQAEPACLPEIDRAHKEHSKSASSLSVPSESASILTVSYQRTKGISRSTTNIQSVKKGCENITARPNINESLHILKAMC